MGLIKEGGESAVLNDILGDEDHLGDMDFKVASTGEGITVLQMDIKVDDITREIMEQALSQAQAGRLHILDVIGKGGATIRALTEEIGKDGLVHVSQIAEYRVKSVDAELSEGQTINVGVLDGR